MNESEQRGLGDYATRDEGRPDEEAAVVAGDAGQAVSEVVDAEDLKFPEAEGTLEMTVTQVDYTVEGSGATEYPVVHVFGRTAGDEAEHVRVLGMEPYFYVPTENVEDRALTEEYDAILDTRTEDPSGERFESIRGKPLTKVVGRTPRDVGRIRDDFDEHYEADILFPNRFLIDKDVSSGLQVPVRRLPDGRMQVRYDDPELVATEAPAEADLRVNTFDIEVDDRSGFPEDGEEPIVCLTSHDSYRDEYVVWLYEAPHAEVNAPESLPEYEPIADSGTSEVRAFEEEAAMLDAFVEYIEETDPDVLTGWNFEDFDMPYVLDRLERLDSGSEYDLDIDRLSRVGEVWRSDWGGPDVKGRVVFDLLYGYKQIVIKELESFRLDAIGERELDVGKEHYSGDIGDLWEQDPEQLLEYNLRDVELCVEIDRKQDVVSFWNQVRSLVGCKLEDAPTAGDAVDMYVLHKAYGEFALPSKGQQEAAEEFEGGAVFEPITGVKENVTVLDLKSLYPMSMATINSSPETKVDPEEYDGETYRSPDGTHFRKEPDGIMREMIDELLTEREEKKELRDQHEPDTQPYEQYDKQQASVKVVMNCFTRDTDVLTPEGVRNIRDLGVGDEVYSLDPETEEMEVKPVTETHAYPEYDGELVDIRTSKIDFRVTPNHRMLVRKNETNGITEDGYSFVEAGELDDATNYELPHGWTTDHGDELGTVDLVDYVEGEYEVWVRPEVHGHTFTAELGYYPDKVKKDDAGQEGYVLGAEEYAEHREFIESVCERSFIHRESGRKWIPRTFDGDDFLDLLAWYVTEGNVYTSEEKQFGEKLRGSATTTQIAQQKPTVADGGATAEETCRPESDHAAIGALLDRMGFDCYVDDRCYQFTSRLLGETLERLCGGDSFEKRIPEFVFDLSEREKRRFLETLVAGDVDERSSSGSQTQSDNGDRQPNSWRYTTSSERLRDDVLRLCTHLGLTANYGKDSGSWRIYVAEDAKNTLRMHRSSSTSTAENGVYCVTVADNHSLLAGRNGTFQFVGQSLYGVSGWDRFRLYDTEGAAAVTATGREVIEFTETAAEEIGHEVAYGDTDSVMISLGDDVSQDEAIEQSFSIEEHINQRYDDFAADELNADSHRFEIEFEKLYRRFFQAGKKKRYAGHIVWKEGKDVDDIDITGFEYKRSDIAPITKRVQKEVIDMIVRGDDLDDVKEYLHEVISDFQEGNVDLEQVGIPGGIGKRLDAYDTDTAQVRGAKYANLLLGTNFQRGSKPKRLYLKKVHPEFWQAAESGEDALDPQRDPLYAEFKRDPDVICFEYAEEVPDSFEVDWGKMLDKTLKGPIERVIEALGLSWDEVKSGQEQTGLGQWG